MMNNELSLSEIQDIMFKTAESDQMGSLKTDKDKRIIWAIT